MSFILPSGETGRRKAGRRSVVRRRWTVPVWKLAGQTGCQTSLFDMVATTLDAWVNVCSVCSVVSGRAGWRSFRMAIELHMDAWDFIAGL